MKKLIFTSLLISSCICANATVITVNNNPNSPGTFTALGAAITAAANNDTLYVHGSATDYGATAIVLTKPLTIIGAGSLPNKNYNFPTKISTLTLGFNSVYTSSGSGSKIIGCDISNLYLQVGNNTTVAGISNVIAERNKIGTFYFYQGGTNAALAHDNITIKNNVITTISGYNGSIKNIIIKNNIITGSISSIGNAAIGNWVIMNNFFTSAATINYCNSATITNNIFYSSGTTVAFGTTNTYCTLNKNSFISVAYLYKLSDIIYGTNTGAGNLLNTDPQFTEYDVTINPSSYTHIYPVSAPFMNLNLKASSLCKNVGTDGTDLGIYGGLTPFVEGYPKDSRFMYFPMPAIPQMVDMNILNGSILPNGTLNVRFKAHKQD